MNLNKYTHHFFLSIISIQSKKETNQLVTPPISDRTNYHFTFKRFVRLGLSRSEFSCGMFSESRKRAEIRNDAWVLRLQSIRLTISLPVQ